MPCPPLPSLLYCLILFQSLPSLVGIELINRRCSCAVGFINVSRWSPTYDELERLNDDVEVGGVWRPRTCRSRDRVALVVPYRNRDAHLRTFLHHIHPFLQKQQLHYGIHVVEQVATSTTLLSSTDDALQLYADNVQRIWTSEKSVKNSKMRCFNPFIFRMHVASK